MTPAVSILIPAFNAAASISETLASAVNQSWQRKEIIVVDDGSTDGTSTIARQFGGVQVIVQENMGAAAARNTALRASCGDFIQWLDADDLLAPNKIAKQLESLGGEGEATLLSCAWGSFYCRPHAATFIPTLLWCDLSPVEWMLRKLEHNLYMQTATWLVARSLLNRAGPWRTDLLGDDDGEYFCRVLAQSRAIRFVPDSRVFYRRPGPSSLSYIGRSNAKLEAQFRSMQLHISYMLAMEDSARSRAACVTYLQNWAGIFHAERPDLVIEAQKLAAEFGGDILPPPLSTKYMVIRKLLGRSAARRAQLHLPRARWATSRWADKMMMSAEKLTGHGPDL